MTVLKNWFNTSQKIAFWILGVVVVVLGYLVIYDRFAPNSSDAFLDAYVIAVKPQVNGNIRKVFVHDNQFVKKNDPLFEIDPRPYIYQYRKGQSNLVVTEDKVKQLELAVAKAREDVDQNRAEFENVKIHYLENKALYERGVISLNTFIDSETLMNSTQDQLMKAEYTLLTAIKNLGPNIDGMNVHMLKAKSDLREATFYLKRTRILAPSDGYVTNVRIKEGTYAAVGNTQIPFVDTTQWWVVANLKENNLGRVTKGQKVWVTLNLYPEKIFEAEVESVGWGVLSSSDTLSNYLPVVEKTNNWVRLAQRFPVRIKIKEEVPEEAKRVGASAIVTVFTMDDGMRNWLPKCVHWFRTKLQYFY